MFVGRERELEELDNLYTTKKFQCVVIYGRRRIGKTALINEFTKNKPTIYFTGLETNSKDNLTNLSQCIYNFKNEEGDTPIYTSFNSAFNAIYELSKERKVIFVIDEYPYLAKSHKGMSSILQLNIDKKYINSNLFLILCGSSMSFMENQVLGYKSPLYGRRTAQFKVKPFDFFGTRKFFNNFNPFDMATVYGITGGIPQYIIQMNDRKTLETNIKNNFFKSEAYLFEEPLNLLKQEVREPATYNAIIKAIATGSSKSSVIASKVGLESSALATYLKNLISLGIVKKETPITLKTTKKTIYSIDDNMFRFWYRFIPNNMALIQNGLGDRAYKKVEPLISDFMGKVFEDICKQYLWQLNIKGECPVEFIKIGRWWGNNPKKRCEAEIDILAFDDNNNAILGECKWTNEKLDMNTLETLVERSKLFNYKKIHFYLFSKTGFKDNVVNKAKKADNIHLIFFEQMIGVIDQPNQ